MKKNIADILKDFTEEPSPRCWKNIEQQLPAVNSSGPESESVPDTSVSSSAVKSSLMQKSAAFWGKVAAVTITTATVATLTVVAIVHHQSGTATDPAPQTPAETVIIADDSLRPDTTYHTPKEILPPVDHVIKESDKIRHSKTTTETHSGAGITDHRETAPAQPLAVSTGTPAPSSAPESQHTPQVIQSNTSETLAAPSSINPVTQVKEIAEDPVIRNRAPEEEEINYDPPVKLEIPNVITPNGDGINDLFEIRGIEYCDKAHLIIQNRSGKTVFESRQYQNNWGSDAEEGTYYYYFYYTINGIEEAGRGTLTVLKR